MRDITETMTFTTEEIRRENIKAVLREVSRRWKSGATTQSTRLPVISSATIRLTFHLTKMRGI